MTARTRSVWLITGAAGALGRELTTLVLKSGADCVALDRDRRGLDELHDSLVESGLGAPALMPLDLVGAGPEDYAELAERIEREFGGLDVLVHNAAEFKALRPLEHHGAEEWFRILQAGLNGPFLLTGAMLPLLRAGERSRIVFIADRHCIEQPANWGAYGASQAGREWMARALAAEVGPRGPEVLDIDPGAFYSRLRAAAWPVATPDELPTAATAAARVHQQIQGG